MKKSIRKSLAIILLSILFPLFLFLGDHFKNTAIPTFRAALYVVCSVILFLCFAFYPFLKKAVVPLKQLEKRLAPPNLRIVSILFSLLFLLSLLACFPGVFSYDCYEEYQMIRLGQLTSHHPVLHVIVLGGLCHVSLNLFGTANPGILVYVLLQMFCYLCIFRYILKHLQTKHTPVLAQYTALLFWMLSPVVNLYVTCTSKDALFSIFELLFLYETYRITTEKENYFSDRHNRLRFIAASILTMILRKNGVYIAVPVFLMLLFVEKKRAKLLCKCLVPILVINLLYAGPFYSLLHVTPGSSIEMLSVPLQQMSRAYKYNADRLNPEELHFLTSLISTDALANYRIGCADAVKNGVDRDYFSANKSSFLKYWLSIGLKNPMTYVNAFLLNTVDFWYPLTTYNGYENLYGMDPGISNYFDYRVAEPGEEIIILPSLHQFYHSLSTDLQVTRRPFVSLFTNSGWYILFWLMTVIVSWYKKQRHMIPIHTALLLSLLTVLAGPMALVRYILIFYYVFPLLILWAGIFYFLL